MPESDAHTPVISIIVPIYNTAPYLKDCISSVLRQTFDSFELILVDDNSTDNCQKICQEACKRDHRVRFIHCPEHKGISHARNQGIEASSGIYLFFLDSDDCLHPGLLEQMQKQAIQTHSDDYWSISNYTSDPNNSEREFLDSLRYFCDIELLWAKVFCI